MPLTYSGTRCHQARRAAAESIVLLKNEGGLLPLQAGEKVAVIGDFAQTPRYQGAGSSAVNSLQVDSVLDCIEASGLSSVGFAPGFDRQGRPDDARKAEAVALARKADTVLLFLGLDEIKESEGIDRSDMKLAVNQLDLLEAIAQVNPNVVVVLSAGASLETPWLHSCRALVYGALGGQAGAGAMLDVLTGKICPSGKLAETWANAYHETPACAHFGTDGHTVEYREGLYVGYRHYASAGIPVRFPFGHGLSYTGYVYRGAALDADTLTPGGTVTARVTVKNSGAMRGAEVVQLYVADATGAPVPGGRVPQALRRFAKIDLQPGEEREVVFTLTPQDISRYSPELHAWCAAPGRYEIRIGHSSRDIRAVLALQYADAKT